VGARRPPDQADFADLYAREAERILHFLVRRTFDPELALDLTAETFLEAFTGRARYRGTTDEEARAWLYGIARRRLARTWRRRGAERRALRRHGVQVPHIAEDDLALIEHRAGLGGLRAAVADALGELSDGHREAVRLRVVDELDYDEVARRLGISEENARARVSRGLRALGRLTGEEPAS
jgi:RNA polymerase sigma-70 factor (ECF subfamily)